MNYVGAGVNQSGDSPVKLRAGVYARFSQRGQRETSIEDQLRECRETAEKKGWVICDEYVRCDKAKTGRTLAGRKGLQELVALAGQKPRPYDVLMCHSTSRAGRNLSDTLPLIDELIYYGITLYFVDSGLSSDDPNFRDVYLMHGRNDEHYSRMLGVNVKRGQRGRVLDGFVACARTFGYFNRAIEDPVETAAYGRPKVKGVQHEINPAEEKVIVRSFQMCADGVSASRAVKTLNREGVPAPLDGKNGKKHVWHVGTMIRLLTNSKYIGVHVYNKRKQVRNPKTGAVLMVPRPESEWDTVSKPEWRIVSDELWHAAQLRLRHKKFKGRMLGGLNKSEQSRRYIFSGTLRCRPCKGRINVVQARKTDPLYGCHGCRYNGTCENDLQVSQSLLEGRLIAAMAANLEDPALRKLLTQEFRKQLQEAINAHEAKIRDQEGTDALLSRKEVLVQKRAKMLKAVQDGAPYAFVRDGVDANEAELQSINDALARPSGPPPKLLSEKEVDEFLARKMRDIASVFLSDPELAKQEVQKRIDELWLEPIDTEEGPAYKVTGDLRLFATPEDRMVNSSLKISVLHSLSIPITTVVLARQRKAPALTLKEAMRQVLLDQPGYTCTTRVLAVEIQERGLYVRRDGKIANWKQINKEAVDCPHLFRFLGVGVIELIEVSAPGEKSSFELSETVVGGVN